MKKILLIVVGLVVQNMAHCQEQSAFKFGVNLSFFDYNNKNIRWEPHGLVRMGDSGMMFCQIRTNVNLIYPWDSSKNFKKILWENLNDSTKDFATHVILVEIYSINACKLIDNYFLKDKTQLFWRRTEKELYLKYWKSKLGLL